MKGRGCGYAKPIRRQSFVQMQSKNLENQCMRNYSHWTPRYALARLREEMDRRINPNDPWLTREAIDLLSRLLRITDVALEFGSGRSTLWFAKRLAKLTSVEDNAEWFQTVREMLRSERINNVDLVHCPRDVPDVDGMKAAYVGLLDRFPKESLDFVLIDGIYRNHCAMQSIAKVKPGGIIIIDNVNWFLPSSSYAPSSRSQNETPIDATWQAFVDRTRDWRRIWSSNGVTDTVILFKS